MQVLLDYPGVNIPFGRYVKRQFGELQQQTQPLIGIPRKCFLTLDIVLVSGGFKSSFHTSQLNKDIWLKTQVQCKLWVLKSEIWHCTLRLRFTFDHCQT
jgi:hypothetical protein